MRSFSRRLALTAISALALLGASQPMAQTAGQPIKFIVPYPAGGATDALARMVAQKMQDSWQQSVVVENKPGAGGTIGRAAVHRDARANPVGTHQSRNHVVHPIKDDCALGHGAFVVDEKLLAVGKKLRVFGRHAKGNAQHATGPCPSHGAVLRKRQRRQTPVGAHLVSSSTQVWRTVDQRAIQIKQDGLDIGKKTHGFLRQASR